MTVSPPTPPSTAPTSPTSPNPSHRDCIVAIGSDPEKGDCTEYYSTPSPNTQRPDSSDGNCSANCGIGPGNGDTEKSVPCATACPTIAFESRTLELAHVSEHHLTLAGISKATFNERLRRCLPPSLMTGKLPHISNPWRKEDGRERHISRSMDKLPLRSSHG